MRPIGIRAWLPRVSPPTRTNLNVRSTRNADGTLDGSNFNIIAGNRPLIFRFSGTEGETSQLAEIDHEYFQNGNGGIIMNAVPFGNGMTWPDNIEMYIVLAMEIL